MSESMTVSQSVVSAAERVKAAVDLAEEIGNGVAMTLDEWRTMYKYTCSMPTSPRPGFVYATGPHKQGSDPTTDPWYRVEVQASSEPGYADHIPKRIVITDGPTDSPSRGRQ